MYKLLLCWRYLRTRYLAMVCIVSVMLGVATLIVVNSVMGGFSTKLKDRLHGLLSDIVIEEQQAGTFDDPDRKMNLIRGDPFLAERVEAMTAVHETFAMLIGEGAIPNTRPVHVIGIDPKGRALIGGFQEFLQSPRNRADPSRAFEPDEEAYRRYWNELMLRDQEQRKQEALEQMEAGVEPPPDLPLAPPPPVPSGSAKPLPEAPTWHDRPHVPQGAIIGYALSHYRRPSVDGQPPEEVCTLERGESIVLTTVKGKKLTPVYDRFIVTDYVKTEMSEYDSNYIFVPLQHLQRLRGMGGRVTSIQIKLKDYGEAKAVVERLQQLFEPMGLDVKTWEQKQGPLLAAISIEKGILNVLLFLIIAVAGFEILAIFSMIVVEKTRDIGILKALGASNGGVMKIFLSYGLLLGLVGSALGTGLGLLFTHKINEIESFLGKVTGQGEIFNRSIYYFDRIPTDIQPMNVLLVNLGAIVVAVLFSVLPALRAAMLHPVRALRFE
jgi:lipoprotein-releasing system permease protein